MSQGEALVKAAEAGSVEGVRAALHAAATGGEDALSIINRIFPSGKNGSMGAIHAASCCDNCEIVDILLEQGANVNLRDDKGNTALHIAIAQSSINVARTLLSAGVDVTLAEYQDGMNALQAACDAVDVGMVRLLVDHGADVNSKQLYQDKMSPLHIASMWDAADIVEVLLSKGADFNIKGHYDYTPLHTACKDGNADVAVLLLEAGADVDAVSHSIRNSETPLHLACDHGHLEVVNILIEHGASLDKGDTLGRTALHKASRSGHAEVVLLLLSDGADTEAFDSAHCFEEYAVNEEGTYTFLRGLTALEMAIEGGHSRVAQVLLSQGAVLDLSFNKRYERYPVKTAVIKGHANVIDLLLRRDIKQMKRCGQQTGETVLHWACENNNVEIVTLLLKHGIDCNIVDSFNREPIDTTTSDDIQGILTTEKRYRKRQPFVMFLANYQFLKPPARYPRETVVEKVFATRDLHRYIIKFL